MTEVAANALISALELDMAPAMITASKRPSRPTGMWPSAQPKKT